MSGQWIAIAGLIVTIGGIFAGFVGKFSKMENEIEHNRKADEEYRQKNDTRFETIENYLKQEMQNMTTLTSEISHLKQDQEGNREKFADLFNSRTDTTKQLAELTTTVKILVQNMDKQFDGLKSALDEVKQEIRSEKK